jgi:hypothetical protein
MNSYERTSIWQRCLANQLESDDTYKERELLRVEFENFRENSKILANEIAKVLPEFTVHDITHIDALWDTADLITSNDFNLTPTEAFVLGGSFLLHDLGMAVASFQNGIDEIKDQQIWRDTVAALRREQKKQNTPDSPELTRSIEQEATEKVLRLLHAQNAEKLAMRDWKDKDGKDFFLISNPQLRLSYGSIIGQIAHSHWWPAQELDEKLPKLLGAPGIFPSSWTVDAVKLACILRVADASQIDDRRAPQFLRILRNPKGYSDLHWNFQSKIYQPRLESARLVFTSKSAFSVDEVQSWWICYDTLKMIDNELREVDSLLTDTGRPKLQAFGVAGIEDPKRLAKLITVDGWEPIDTSVKVTNIAKLAQSLGGKQLYGDNPTAPMRELIQNAADAIRARLIYENESEDFGKIEIRFGKDEIGEFIEVEDNGIGMSKKVLTGPFLDFGNSFWGSSLMHEELPGLEDSNFESTGKYGIGFYSVFMWGEKVTVYSRRFEAARNETLALEFSNGASSRPTLRQAVPAEQIKDGGTRVKVWLSGGNTISKLSNWRSYTRKSITAHEFIESLCPSIDCNLYVEQDGQSKKVIIANDWLTMKPLDLIVRTIGISFYEELEDNTKEYLERISQNVKEIKDDFDVTVGRVAIFYPNNPGSEISGIMTVGGIATTPLNGILGVLVGNNKTASRNSGIPSASTDAMIKWSTDQANMLSFNTKDIREDSYSSIVRLCGGHTGSLRFARQKNDFLNHDQIAQIARQSDHREFIIVNNYRIEEYEHENFKRIALFDNVFVTKLIHQDILSNNDFNRYDWWPRFHETIFRSPLENCIIDALAEGWSVSTDEIVKYSSISSHSSDNFVAEVGTVEGEIVKLSNVNIIRRSV